MLISLQQLFAFLEENEETPFKALKYCIGECNYGGRVTDGKDRITLNSIMERFFNEEVLETGYKMSQSGTYSSPGVETREEFLEVIEGLPLVAPPEIFGFHENANITKHPKQTNAMFATCLLCEGGGGGASSGDKDATIAATAGDIKEKLPAAYDMEQAAISYPVLWEQSMNTVLCQELARFNNLTNAMKKSLVEVEKAVRGIVVMSGPLEALGDSLVYGAIPLMWKVCCPRPVLSRRFRPPRHRRDATQSHTGQVVPLVQAARRLRDRSPREIELLTRMAGREAASHLLDLGVLLPARLHDGE